MITAYDLSMAGDKYLGTPYSTMDCQAFVERCLADIGIKMDLSGSNAWFRKCTWRGTPEECKARFGSIPKGAFLFIWDDKGGERARGYYDGLGDATHIGIYTGRGKGAIHSSYTNNKVCESSFAGKSINGGWDRVGLWDQLSYGDTIDQLLTGQETPKEEGSGGGKPVTRAKVILPQGKSGKTVNLRAGATTAARVIAQVPVGADVDIENQYEPDWSWIRWNNLEGWMMSEFLEPIPEEPGEIGVPPEEDDPKDPGEGMITVQLPETVALTLWEILEGVLGKG